MVVDRGEDDCNESSTKSPRVCGETRLSFPAHPEGLSCDALRREKARREG